MYIIPHYPIKKFKELFVQLETSPHNTIAWQRELFTNKPEIFFENLLEKGLYIEEGDHFKFTAQNVSFELLEVFLKHEKLMQGHELTYFDLYKEMSLHHKASSKNRVRTNIIRKFNWDGTDYLISYMDSSSSACKVNPGFLFSSYLQIVRGSYDGSFIIPKSNFNSEKACSTIRKKHPLIGINQNKTIDNVITAMRNVVGDHSFLGGFFLKTISYINHEPPSDFYKLFKNLNSNNNCNNKRLKLIAETIESLRTRWIVIVKKYNELLNDCQLFYPPINSRQFLNLYGNNPRIWNEASPFTDKVWKHLASLKVGLYSFENLLNGTEQSYQQLVLEAREKHVKAPAHKTVLDNRMTLIEQTLDNYLSILNLIEPEIQVGSDHFSRLKTQASNQNNDLALVIKL